MRVLKSIMRVVLVVVAVVLLATVLRLGYGLVRTVYATPLPIASATAIPVPAPSAGALPASALAVADPNTVITPTMLPPIVPDLNWLAVFAEVDTLSDIDRAGLQEHTVRYEVLSGEYGSMALVATDSGRISRMRVVVDDILQGIWYLPADRTSKPVDLMGKYMAFHSPKAKVPAGKYTEFKDVADWKFDKMFGASATDILNQFVSIDLNLVMQKGDMVVIGAVDDAGKKVNVGVNAYLDWIPVAKK